MGSATMRLGHSERVIFPKYVATILWHGRPTQVRVLESEFHPLIGVGLLWGNNLSIDFAHDGDVAITEL